MSETIKEETAEAVQAEPQGLTLEKFEEATEVVSLSLIHILDEIEAALDESNVDRFAGYLHKLTRYTQFIVITHRRGTMVSADRLYGITMQEKGVATLVSVSLIEAQMEREEEKAEL